MLILTNTTDKLEVIIGTAADVDTHVSFTDMPTPITPSSNATPGRQNQSRTTAATHELCAAPAASTVRNVKTVHIFNKDTVDATDITVVYDQNGTDFVLHKVNLAPGEALEYIEGIGWFEIAPSAEQVQYARKSSQQTHGATSFTDVTGLGFAVSANRVYEFEWDLIFRSAATTTGIGFAVNGPASPTSVQGGVLVMGVRGAATAGAFGGFGFAAYDSPNASTIAVEATGTDYVARVSCLIEVGGTAGTVIPRVRAEVAANVTIEVGSYGTCKLIR